ncbi:MAG: hypothetical protein KAQ90_04150 [Melioribacteraceae bacterium]|nr:hypothetical protein [Melioribacteraceae bacterium]
MGFSTLIDILGSIVIGGLLFMILLRLHEAAVANSFQYNGELIVQQNLVEVVKLLEHDFRKIGYCADWQAIPDPSKSIITADSNSISFLTDVNSDGTPDTLLYYLGPLSELEHTPNPRDRMLYRIVNGATPAGSNLGITQFELHFFDAFGTPIPFPIVVPGEINTMQINITVEDVAAYSTLQYNEETGQIELEGNYSSVFWRQIRLAARNLGNR